MNATARQHSDVMTLPKVRGKLTADAPLVDLGKIEQGRTLTEAEIKTLPLTSRNPYNFALLQPGVVGFENQEFGVPRITSNGALLRVNYQMRTAAQGATMCKPLSSTHRPRIR